MASFRLHSGDSEFNNRVDALFSSLQTVAVDLPPQGTKRPHEDDDSNDGEKDEEFCRPQGLPPRRGWAHSRGGRGKLGPRNSTPDYVQNPEKWTRYNMKDTKVLSDRENKREGLKLFHDLQARRMQDEDTQDEKEESSDKIVFKKPIKLAEAVVDVDAEMAESSDTSAESADALFGGTTKIKLPEYEVGKVKTKSKPKKIVKGDGDGKMEKSSKEVKLGYLMFEEEEEEDG